jgi:hypothetical protein
MNTLFLLPDSWDLVTDASGNIAMATNPYSQAQDAASAIKLFDGELYYNTSLGVPYWSQILGRFPPLSLVKLRLQQAALRVPGVVAAVAVISSFKNRELTGQVQIANSDGATATAAFAPPASPPAPPPPPDVPILLNETGEPLLWEGGGGPIVT